MFGYGRAPWSGRGVSSIRGEVAMSDDNQPTPPRYGYPQTPQQSADPSGPPQQAPPGYEQGQSGYGHQQAPSPQKPRKRRRIFLWFFLAVQAIFLIWIIAGAQANHCSAQGSVSANGACTAGTAIGVVLIIGLWVAVDVILGISYIIFRRSTRNR